LTFDPIAAAESAADLTLTGLLNPARASRLVQYHMRVQGSPSLRGVMEAISTATAYRQEGGHTMSSEVERAVEFRGLEAMLGAGRECGGVKPGAGDCAIAHCGCADSVDDGGALDRYGGGRFIVRALINRIEEFEKDPAKFVPAAPVESSSWNADRG